MQFALKCRTDGRVSLHRARIGAAVESRGRSFVSDARFAMILICLCCSVAAVAVYVWLNRRAYRIDAQGRYFLLDLHTPKLPLTISFLNAVGNFARKHPFNADLLLDEAQKHTGLSELGDEDCFPFRDGLHQFLAEVNAMPLTFLGRTVVKDFVTRTLATCLRIENLIKHHPDILKEEIRSPVFVVGLPRSGTTVVQSFLAQLDGYRGLRKYETLELVQSKEVSSSIQKGVDPRVRKTTSWLEGLKKIRPLLWAMHEWEEDGVEEHNQLTTPVFRSCLFMSTVHCPEYLEWYGSVDATVEFEYLRRVLQVLQWQDAQLGRKPQGFLLKNPWDTFSLPCLKKVFPDAKVIHMYREPSTSLLSLLHLFTYCHGISYSTIDLKSTASRFLDYFEKQMRKTDVSVLGEDRLLVKYEDFVADNGLVFTKIAEFLGVDLGGEGTEKMRAFIERNKQHKFGKVQYDPEAFGLDMEEIEERFKFYADLCGVE